MWYYLVLRGIDERAIKGGTWNKGKLGLMAERLFLDPIGYGNWAEIWLFLGRGGVKKPPHDQAPVF